MDAPRRAGEEQARARRPDLGASNENYRRGRFAWRMVFPLSPRRRTLWRAIGGPCGPRSLPASLAAQRPESSDTKAAAGARRVRALYTTRSPPHRRDEDARA